MFLLFILRLSSDLGFESGKKQLLGKYPNHRYLRTVLVVDW